MTPAPTSDRGLTDKLVRMMKGAAVGGLFHYRLAVSPKPTPRPRVSKWGAYYPKEYQVYAREVLKQTAEAAAPAKAKGTEDGEPVVVEGRLGVVVDIAVDRPKRTSLASPRGDADNFAKAILDAATQARVWKDDAQAAILSIVKRWTEPGEDAGVSVWIGKLA